ncbi:fructosamine kinase [Abyssogena phaseoliformis symbiont OG214]|uniref:fructosamine kinase family protein n=1 Tax=Abyssogena phaseoliformis symbiont TaxID=596095 RepID=UPI001916BA0B|nr:fructosamine kinase family protein [Abyssogena phaseoliformis symbiont]BBB23072.1 fructosamine kinase [Abyssogena phaseoliformis symbiont OG214]
MPIEVLIKQHLNQKITHKQSIGTGIFIAYKVKLDNHKTVFIKYQSSPNQQLIQQGKELQLLGKTITTPKVLGCCEHCLILEWINESFNPNLQSQAGIALAHLHQNTHDYFGFEMDNKIGQTDQFNATGGNITNWSEFYWKYRLLYQIELAFKNNLLNYDNYQQLLNIETKLLHLLDKSIKPALLHGDLWSGNLISGKNTPYFIDSASYYGHCEIDLALTFMFGGFSDDFYHAYHKINPSSAGFNHRKPLYMLYHYLNHLNMFGSEYHQNVMSCYHAL